MKMKSLLSALLIILICPAVFAIAELKPKIKSDLKANIQIDRNITARKYLLGPNDVISIYVTEAEEYDAEKLLVQPDGNIIYAPIGEMNVAGKTTGELRDIIVAELKYYLKDPMVTINLNQTKPFMVYINGAVLNPGSYEINTNTQEQQSYNMAKNLRVERKAPLLSNVLIAAGGIQHYADLEHIKISNSIDKTEFEVNLFDLLSGDSSQDIYLIAGDNVSVPALKQADIKDVNYKKYASASFSPDNIPVKVYGYVNAPGLIYLPANRSLNVNSAITKAGGYLLDSAYAPKRVFISRADEQGSLKTTEINPNESDFMLRPNDIVYIPEKKRPLIGKAFDYTTRILMPANTFASTYNNWALMFDPDRFQVVSP